MKDEVMTKDSQGERESRDGGKDLNAVLLCAEYLDKSREDVTGE